MIRWFGTVLERLRSFCGFLKFLRLAGAAFRCVIIKVLVKVVVFFSAPPPGSIRDKIVIFANLPLFTNDEITLVRGALLKLRHYIMKSSSKMYQRTLGPSSNDITGLQFTKVPNSCGTPA